MAREETKRIYASLIDSFLSQIAEKALSDAFLANSDVANDGLRTSTYHFLMGILMEMAATGGSDEIFDCHIER